MGESFGLMIEFYPQSRGLLFQANVPEVLPHRRSVQHPSLPHRVLPRNSLAFQDRFRSPPGCAVLRSQVHAREGTAVASSVQSPTCSPPPPPCRHRGALERSTPGAGPATLRQTVSLGPRDRRRGPSRCRRRRTRCVTTAGLHFVLGKKKKKHQKKTSALNQFCSCRGLRRRISKPVKKFLGTF